ncbi:GNAT family N-acetyltransferase [Flavobacteriaceae bacterium R38]|nr:GNAT family N-acetyltransferase [Flavobacteriaceae bacterium R38]
MVILETDRLVLKEADLDDEHFFFELLNSPGWIKYIGDRGIESIDDARKYIRESLINSYKENGFGLYKMVSKKENSSIGICGLLKRPGLSNPDIGFAILPAYERKGYTYEAAKAILEYGISTLGLKTILAITTKKNTGSRKLLEKIGLRFVDKIKLEVDGEELLRYSN